MNLQRTYLPVHSSTCERADNSRGPVQAFLPAGLILCLLLLSLLKADLPTVAGLQQGNAAGLNRSPAMSRIHKRHACAHPGQVKGMFCMGARHSCRSRLLACQAAA